MGLKKLIKRYDFTSRMRKNLTFSDKTKIRLDDDDKLNQGLALKLAGANYDMGLGNTVTLPKTEPKKLKRWIGFEALEDLPANTSVGYRLIVNNGASEIYWDGAAWSAATLDAHWNDFKTVNANISDLLPTGFDISAKVNLRTTDGKNTPKVMWIKFLVEVMFDPWDDLIYDTVIGSLRDTLRAATALEFAAASVTNSINLGVDPYKLENVGYNFTDALAVYNLTADPNSFKNIVSGYTPGAANPDGSNQPGVVALSENVNPGDIIRIELEHVPEIAVYTNQEYVEPEKLPALVFERIAAVRLGDRTDQETNDREGDYIRNFDTFMAIQVPIPRQSTVRFEYAIWGSPLDIARLADAMDKWINDHRILRSWAFDEELNLDPINEIETDGSTNSDDVVMAQGVFQLRGVPFYTRDAKEVPLVKVINSDLTTI